MCSDACVLSAAMPEKAGVRAPVVGPSECNCMSSDACVHLSLQDIEAVDPEYYKNLKWMLENNITDVLDLTFTEESDYFGKKELVELKPGGKDIRLVLSVSLLLFISLLLFASLLLFVSLLLLACYAAATRLQALLFPAWGSQGDKCMRL